MSLRLQVGQAIQREQLWVPGDAVAVAVSGGADSVALLHLLVETSRWHGAVLSVVTVDHGSRVGSAEDAAFVEALAAQLGLPCQTARVRPNGRSEEGLRRARHAVFAQLPVDRVATAHHRRDQAETVLLRLIRGTATQGLGAIRWRNGLLVRPLLASEPEAIRAYLSAHGATWREDPSNADPSADRNRIRHEVLPILRAIRPGAERALARTAQRLAEEALLLEGLARSEDPGDLWPDPWIAAVSNPLLRLLIVRRAPMLPAAAVDGVVHAVRNRQRIEAGAWEVVPTQAAMAWAARGPLP